MKPLFVHGHPINFRMLVFVMASIFLMIADYQKSEYLRPLRTQLSAFVYPIHYLVNLPVQASQWLSLAFSTRVQLLEEKDRLYEENLRLHVALQKLEDLKKENEWLHHLLGATKKINDKVQVADVIAVELDSSSRKIMIDKGKNDGVFEGQAVLDAQGVMGQVTQVGWFSSTVMLITDRNHKLPVQVVRTGVQTVAQGGGIVNRLILLYLPNIGVNGGIKVGDLLVTSGLGGYFPPGYPVGTVVEVNPDIGQPYAQVQAVPTALLERNRKVLLTWRNPPEHGTEKAISGEQ